MEKSLGPRKVLRAPALRRGREIIPISDRVKLDKVLGLTVSNNASFDCDPQSSIVAYPAGCVVVLYNVRKNKQHHILSSSKKTITSLAFSGDGRYLATGECGHQPHVRVWDVQEKCQVAEFQGHKYGINCVAFSPNLKYVVSVGSQHDMIVNVWDWKSNIKIASNKVSCKVKAVSFASSGSYFVTVGNRHVKFWYLEGSRSAKHKLEAVPLMGRSAILGDQRNNYFCDVACGKGKMAESTYAITKSGLLCEFNSRRLLDKWVELRTTSANSISVGELYIFIGCASGIIRCFNPFNLNFICTLPKSHYLGIDVAKGIGGNKPTAPSPSSNLKYPDTIAIALDEVNRKVTCIYNDHSLYVWDIKDMKKIGKSHSYMYHSACIWGVETYPEFSGDHKRVLPRGTFLTCSSDDTIRFWNLEHDLAQDTAYHRNIYSSELLKILYTDAELSYLCDMDFNPSGSNDRVDATYDGKNGVRCLRISPNGRHLASGDRSGNIRIHDLEYIEELCKVEAHDSEVLCLEYSNPVTVEGEEKKYLASASRDRLIHVFDVKQDYAFQQTLDDHSSSITAVRFVHNENTLQMISCGADKSIIFRKATFNPQLSLIREHHVVGKTTLYDMEVDVPQRQILTACQDRNIRVYSVVSGKQVRYFRGSQGEDGTLIKVVLDPSGTYLATSCTDKSLYIYDYSSGECLATMFGHSELVTGLTFSNDGQHLISVSGDGCIFVWRLPLEVTQTMLSKRPTVVDNGVPVLWQDGRKSAVAVTKPLQLLENNVEKIAVNNHDLVNGNVENGAAGYRFSVGQLPLWAKKQMLEDMPPRSMQDKKLAPPIPPRGRWAQRIDGQGLVVRSYLDSDAVIPYPGIMQRENDESTEKQAVKENDKMEFEPSEESLKEIMSGPPGEEEENGSRFVLRQTTGGVVDRSERPSRPVANLNHVMNMRLEDMDAEDERSDSEISEMIYYPVSEDGSDPGDGSFHVCANGENDQRASARTVKTLKPERLFSNMPAVNTPEQLETNSDEEEVSTPVDSDKSFLSSLCISTENLEKLGQREKFMRSNYESLEKENAVEGRDQESEDRSFYRQSISAKFLAGSLAANVKPASASTKPFQASERQTSVSTSKREELNKALTEAKKKLETVGFRSGLSSSKSIGDLQIMRDKDNYRRSRSTTPDTDIRRATSMIDLSGGSAPRRLFSPPNVSKNNTRNSAPLWEQGHLNSSEDVSPPKSAMSFFSSTDKETAAVAENSNAMSRSISMSSLYAKNRHMPSMNKSPSIYMPNRNSNFQQNVGSRSVPMVPLRRNNLPSLPPRSQMLSVVTTSTLATDSSSDSSPTDTASKDFSAHSNTGRSRFLSIGEADKSNPKHSLLRSKMKSRSEWDLKGSGSSNPSLNNSPVNRHLSKLNCNNRNVMEAEQEVVSASFLNSDPATVPLTQELCEDLSEMLKKVSLYAMQIYQRIMLCPRMSTENKLQMSNLLAQSLWQAQQTLRPTVPLWSSPSTPSLGPRRLLPGLGSVPNGDLSETSFQGRFSTDSQHSQPEVINTMALLQQFSDKLLNIVEQQIGNKNNEDKPK